MNLLEEVYVELAHPLAKVPVRGSENAAGFDLFTVEEGVVHPDKVIGVKTVDGVEVECKFNDPDCEELRVKRSPVVFNTGVKFEIPDDWELEVRSRSGLTFKYLQEDKETGKTIKYDVVAFNGTVDADFRGELKVKVWNNGTEPLHVEVGSRIAQAVFKQVKAPKMVKKAKLSETDRGEGSFGESGLTGVSSYTIKSVNRAIDLLNSGKLEMANLLKGDNAQFEKAGCETCESLEWHAKVNDELICTFCSPSFTHLKPHEEYSKMLFE